MPIAPRHRPHIGQLRGVPDFSRETPTHPTLLKGQRNERRVHEALGAEWEKPPWLASFRRATTEEDLRGIDVVITTEDMGELNLQVKSSLIAAEKFMSRIHRRHWSRRIGVIVVGHRDTPATLQEKIMRVLRKLRHKVELSRTGRALPEPLALRRRAEAARRQDVLRARREGFLSEQEFDLCDW